MQRPNRSLLLLFLLAALVCTFAVGPAAWSKDADLKQADALFEAKNYAEAAVAYRGLLDVEEAATVRHASRRIVLCELRLNRFDPALEAAEAYVERMAGTPFEARAQPDGRQPLAERAALGDAGRRRVPPGRVDAGHPGAVVAARQGEGRGPPGAGARPLRRVGRAREAGVARAGPDRRAPPPRGTRSGWTASSTSPARARASGSSRAAGRSGTAGGPSATTSRPRRPARTTSTSTTATGS